MPSINYHIAHSISPPEKARLIHESLDNISGLPFFDMAIHMKWRKLTHQPWMAVYIGFLFNGIDGAVDALRHLTDDLLYSQIFKYSKEKEEEEWQA